MIMIENNKRRISHPNIIKNPLKYILFKCGLRRRIHMEHIVLVIPRPVSIGKNVVGLQIFNGACVAQG